MPQGLGTTVFGSSIFHNGPNQAGAGSVSPISPSQASVCEVGPQEFGAWETLSQGMTSTLELGKSPKRSYQPKQNLNKNQRPKDSNNRNTVKQILTKK